MSSLNNHIVNINNESYHFNAKAINNLRNHRNKDNDYCLASNKFNDDNSSVDESYDGDYECNSNYDEEYPSLWGVFNETPKRTGSSYATMLKKPKILDIPMFLEKDLGNKKVKVRFDSYHMLIKPKLNRFYCMVCKEYSHIRAKAEHCSDIVHLDLLDQIEVTDKFGDYYIRVVSYIAFYDIV